MRNFRCISLSRAQALEAAGIDVGGDLVVAVLRYGGRARLSGIETDEALGAVFAIRDRKIVRGREYATRQQALHAAGLAE